MVHRSAPNLNLVNRPHIVLYPNTSSSQVCRVICNYSCSSPLQTLNILREVTWVLTSGSALERLSWKLSPGPGTCFRCPGAWPSLATHYAEAPQWAVCAVNSLCHNVGHPWATEQGLRSETFTVAISGNDHKGGRLFLNPTVITWEWKFLRVLIQGCNLMWNVPEGTPKSFCVFPEYCFLN